MSDLRVKTDSGWRDARGTSDARQIVASKLMEVRQTKILAAAGNYAAEDVLSENATVGTCWTFANAMSSDEGSGIVIKAQALCSTTSLTPRLSLYLFNKIPTSVLRDNIANTAVLTADLPHYQGIIDFMSLGDLGGYSEATATPSTVGNLPLSVKCLDRNLYGVAITRDAETGEAAGMTLTFILTIEQC